MSIARGTPIAPEDVREGDEILVVSAFWEAVIGIATGPVTENPVVGLDLPLRDWRGRDITQHLDEISQVQRLPAGSVSLPSHQQDQAPPVP